MRRDLLALGSAAVLAVYSAGYQRTQEAADRFANETEHRRRPPRPVPAESPTATAAAVATKPVKADPPASAKVKSTSKRAPTPASAGQKAAPDSLTPPADSVATQGTQAAPATQATQTPAAALPAPATPVAIAPPADSAAAAPAADSAHAAKPAPKWKDGVFTAWGTSRHGDLEASVQIMNGRIVAAWISQCWTRYPCSRIAALPPQVVQRQSENVDTISGVTQSADAFYYGVMEALIKAKP